MANRPNMKPEQDIDPNAVPPSTDAVPPTGDATPPVPPDGIDNIAWRLRAYVGVYVRACGEFTAHFRQDYLEGHVCNALQARALSSTKITRGLSVANSALTRGKNQKDLSDDKKQEWLDNYMAKYELTADIGGEFAYDVLYQATDRIVFALGNKQGHLSGSYDEHNSSDEIGKRAKLVATIMNDPKAANKYEAEVRNMVAYIMTERHVVKTRTSSASAASEIDLGLDDETDA